MTRETRIMHFFYQTLAILVLSSMSLFSTSLLAQQTYVAVAANFHHTAKRLVTQFEKDTGHSVKLSAGSTGKLYAQIRHGAPFEVFLSADSERPIRLELEDFIHPGSRVSYAFGTLMLWMPNIKTSSRSDDPLSPAKVQIHLGKAQRVAIANPATAPYGVAAQEALSHMKQWHKMQTRLVKGESISQAFQFVANRHADAGFVALSQLKQKAVSHHNNLVWPVPPSWYQPIAQQAVLLKKGASNPAARDFLDFLMSTDTQAFIAKQGYDVAGTSKN